MDWEAIWSTVMGWILNTGLKIVIAAVIMFISFRLINWLGKLIQKKNEETKKLDSTLARTLIYAGRILLKVLVVICLISYLGIDTSGFTALIASLGVTIGLAVNGALGNIAGGILLLITRPFRVDDFVEVAGQTGTVEDIRLCNTKLRTVDNRVIYVPNGTASTSSVINYSEKELRRVDLTFPISYESDVEKAKNVILAAAAKVPEVLQDPAVTTGLIALSGSSVDLFCRAWVKNADYWTAYFALQETIKEALNDANVKIPYQQIDVHVKQN
ncbi:MAG: mechanosensitive ion channel family protein [Lachnospiraceae bacterium]|nr:mechanosensitive ion channel family protein [Lachnospiraceae bacterium]